MPFLLTSDDPGPELAAMARRLEAAGADFLVIPCNTAYAFSQSIEEAVDIPLVSIIDETIAALPEGCGAVGLLATEGCLSAGDLPRGDTLNKESAASSPQPMKCRSS